MSEEKESCTLRISNCGAASFVSDKLEIKVDPGGAMEVKASNDMSVEATVGLIEAITTIIELQQHCIRQKMRRYSGAVQMEIK